MATTNGSATYFRGLPSTITEKSDLVIDFPLNAGEHVYKGQALVYNCGNNQASSPVAGTGETGDTNGEVRAMTDGDSYAGAIAGICLKNVNDTDTTLPDYGKRIVPLLIRGIALVRGIVNDTDGTNGYDIPFGAGDLCAVGGGAGGGTLTGSNAVSGFTTLTPGAYFFMPTGATDGSSNSVIGWFLDFQNGSTDDEILSDGTATIADSQAETPQSGYWYRVLVDLPAAHWAGGTTIKFTL